MSLNVDLPDPPTLASVDPNEYDDTDVGGDEYRRDELEAFLADGAWEAAFTAWAEMSDLDRDDWQIVLDLELLSRFDFFWDNN